MKLDIVPCTLTHLEQLQRISKATFSDAFASDNDPKDFKNYLEAAFSSKKLKEELLHPHSHFYFVYLKKQLAAYFKLNTEDAQTEFREDKGMELERIYITTAYQGKGMGSFLLEEIEDLAREKMKAYLWLGVWERNLGAIAFYKKHGFVKIGTHPYYVGSDKQTDWLMRKEIKL